MCPDRQILSVYFDGELGSPWKEKLEKHLGDCPGCRGILESYRRIRRELNVPGEPALAGAMKRIWERSAPVSDGRQRKSRNFWTGTVLVPLPAAAAAGLVMALALTALVTLRQPPKTNDPQLAGLEVQDMTQISDMASLLKYLGGDDSPDMVIIRLPDTTFRNAGEPQMLRAADYSRSAGSR